LPFDGKEKAFAETAFSILTRVAGSEISKGASYGDFGFRSGDVSGAFSFA
jgi:hypothetical protein